MTRPARTGAVVAAVLVGVGAVAVTGALQGLGWLADQALLTYGVDRPWWLWPVVSVANATLVGVPALLLARVARAEPVRAAGRSWLGGAAAVGLLGAVRAVSASEPELYLALLALAALLLLLAQRRFSKIECPPAVRHAGEITAGGHSILGQTERRRPAGWVAAAAGLVVLLPWLWWGALGGALETLLAVVAAAAVGWLASALLVPRFGPARSQSTPERGGPLPPTGSAKTPPPHGGSLPPTGSAGTPPPYGGSLPRTGSVAAPLHPVLRGGLVGGVTLLLVAAGTGASGGQLPLLLMLPPLGFAAVALGRAGRWPVGMLIGLATLGPLGFVDPDEISLPLVTGRDVPFWAAAAAAGSLVLALLLALGIRYASPARRWAAVVTAGAAAVAAAGVHIGLGQPGLHGDRLFVVLADQANLSGLPAAVPGQAGRDARAREVYQRLVSHAETSQADLHHQLDRYGLRYTPYYLVNAVEVVGGPEVRAMLSRRADVDRVLRGEQLRPLPVLAPPASGAAGPAPEDPEWNISMVRADRVWRELGVTGAGIVVGSSDSGVDGSHPALADGFRGAGDSWLDPWNGTAIPTDRIGHGTHTLGSAVGRDGIGVAPEAQWTGCVNLDRNLGSPARYLDCLQFMLAPYPPGGDPWRDGRPDRAPHVLTNSWGCPPIEGCDAGVLRPATAALAAAGLYLVVGAGNAGPFCGSIHDPPATYPDVLTVGAVDRHERVAFFSSRGPVPDADKPDLVAPGTQVLSAMPGGGYARMAGTSMATPHLAGVVALLWSANPDLVGDLATTTRILRDTARPVPVEEEACGEPAALAGAGLVDAYAAVRAATAG